MTLGELARSLTILQDCHGPGAFVLFAGRRVWFRGAEPPVYDTPLEDCCTYRRDVPAHLRDELAAMGWDFVTFRPADGLGFWQATAAVTN